MGNRKALLLTAGFLAALGLAMLFAMFSSSLMPSERAKSDAEYVIDLAPIVLGELQTYTIRNKQLFILRPDATQRASISQLDAYVKDKNASAYDAVLDAYVYWGVSTRWGCPLEHKPPQESRLIEWVSNAKWLGGYWDPQCEVSYDYAGRAITSYEYTYNGFNADFPNMKRPMFNVSGTRLTVKLL